MRATLAVLTALPILRLSIAKRVEKIALERPVRYLVNNNAKQTRVERPFVERISPDKY